MRFAGLSAGNYLGMLPFGLEGPTWADHVAQGKKPCPGEQQGRMRRRGSPPPAAQLLVNRLHGLLRAQVVPIQVVLLPRRDQPQQRFQVQCLHQQQRDLRRKYSFLAHFTCHPKHFRSASVPKG